MFDEKCSRYKIRITAQILCKSRMKINEKCNPYKMRLAEL